MWLRPQAVSTMGAYVTETGGIKHDSEKPDLSLFSRVWLLGVGAVLTFGKRKYAAHNWRKGIEISRLISAALRHILAFNAGEDLDPETGLSHLDHASCCIMFARELIETRPDLDDRYKGPKKEISDPVDLAKHIAGVLVNGQKHCPCQICENFRNLK